MNLKERAKRLKIEIPAIFFVLKHKQTPWYAKIMAGITVGYALSPIDFIPDFIPILGYLDDIILTVKLVPSDVFAECRTQSENIWKEGKPQKWFYAIPIILMWIAVIWLILKAVYF